MVGLGNVGKEYDNTRHNIGFDILNFLADTQNVNFEPKKLGDIANFKLKGRLYILLKPSTYMNLSGKSLIYWMTKEKIPLDNILVVTDDLNLPFGTIRIKAKGSDGGHNGLKNIQEQLNTTQYNRLRFGISGTFSKGHQVDYVLGQWTDEERDLLKKRLEICAEAIKSFALAGINRTMNSYNGK